MSCFYINYYRTGTTAIAALLTFTATHEMSPLEPEVRIPGSAKMAA